MHRRPLRASALLLLVTAAAQAQESGSVVTKLTADFGFVQASGNSQVTTTSFGQKLTQRCGRFGLEQAFNFVYGEQNGVVNTNFLRASLRADYKLGPHFAAFASGAYDRNTFAGIERRFEQNLGVSWRAIQVEMDTLSLEAGGSVTKQTSLDGESNNFPAARAAAAYRHYFSKTSYFAQNAELIPNFKEPADYRINTESAVVAPVSARVNVRVAYLVRYDNLPEPRFQKTDRLFVTGLQVTF